jgi:hypothetical protein
MSYYKKDPPTYFNTEVPSSGGRSIQTNVDLTHQSSYYVALTENSKQLDFKILQIHKINKW